MIKIGFCSKCGKQMWLKNDGSCFSVHSPVFITDVIELKEKSKNVKSFFKESSNQIEWYRSKSLKDVHFYNFVPWALLLAIEDFTNYMLC